MIESSFGPEPVDRWSTVDERHPPLTPRSAAARLVAGIGFLGLAGVMSSRRGPLGMQMWPFGLATTWVGVSHVVAAMTGYRGCPELGAIPSVLQGRNVHMHCPPWHRIDSMMGESEAWRGAATEPRDEQEAAANAA